MSKTEKANTDQKVIRATNDFMAEIERRSDFPAIYILTPLIFSAIPVYFNILPMHITSLVTIIYPVYWTIKALEHKEEDDDWQWYTYWIIWGYFFLLDAFFPNLLKMVPFFYFSKLLFFTWLFLPSTHGALFLYKNYFSKLPIDFGRVTRMTDNFRGKVNKVIDNTLGINQPKEKSQADFSKDVPMSKGDFIKQEESFVSGMPTSAPATTQNVEKEQPSRIKDLYVQSPPKESDDYQHEVRQNIVGDAKIDTNKLKTDMQNVRDQFSHTMDKFKEVRQNISGESENQNTNENAKSRPSQGHSDNYEKKVL